MVETGPTPVVLDHPEADYTRKLLADSPLIA
jgi:ABC-type microcin C transport system duplicated ATPase subunit YejF